MPTIKCLAEARHHLGASRSRPRRSVGNPVENAVKYARRGGRVVVRSSTDAAAIHVEVEDDGPGLPPDLGDRVFEPYVRGAWDVPGLGLGLATVKRLAEAHGGRVGVRSEPGQGATFWFELPRAAAGESPKGADRAPAAHRSA
ncbi:sensor histidine kinase KdpD [Anaeromyxobacter sp. PSR-1]|uniref:sensor histidine kinase n=1 Tax=Anaeromyxobacter sp. PSR-1 TaxID=1300915 RepID=UPI0005DF6985|nr:ATP-binding protein [Anaeromyxobacter sp. PSR-1]GAO01625.1 alginate biosynthesis sensor protein KinB [Anaeromyxobacter sp. PSR-1]